MVKLHPAKRQTALALRWRVPLADPTCEVTFSSELSDAESQFGRKMRCHFQEIHGLATLFPERSYSSWAPD
jgi:hypothetical protein